MVEFINRNLHPKREPKYFYQVHEHVTTFGGDKGNNEGISETRNFEGKDLGICRKEAIDYYTSRKYNLENNCTYFLPFASPENFKFGENAAYSISIALIVGEFVVGEYVEFDYFIGGEDEEEVLEGMERERIIFEELGIKLLLELL